MKTILIFGASGNVGLYLVDYLREHLNPQEYRLAAIGRKNIAFFRKNDIDFFKVDIQRPEDFSVLPVNDVYAVMHKMNFKARLSTSIPMS